jgi:hypothetical protein
VNLHLGIGVGDELERRHAMRLQGMSLPDPMHRAVRHARGPRQIPRRPVGHAGARRLQRQGHDLRSFARADRRGSARLRPLPQAGHALLGKPPPNPAHLHEIEHVRIGGELGDWNAGRRLAAQDTQAELGSVTPVFVDAVDVPTHGPSPYVLIDEHVDRSAGRLRDQRQGLVGDERATGAIHEERHVQDRAVRRETRHGPHSVAHRETREIRDGDTALERPEIAAGHRLQLPVEGRVAADD